MSIIEKLELLHKKLVGFEMFDFAVELHDIIEEYNKQEPFGYFKAEPFGWTDCSETDEGAIALYENAPLSDETVKDAERYRWLCNNVSNSFILTKNDDHKKNYVTAKEWIEEYVPGYFSDDDLNEIQKMKDTDTIWRLQVYPDTPIGFYVWHGATLSYAIDEAMKEDK